MACATGRCLQSLFPLLCVPLVGAAQLPPCRRPTLHPGHRGLGCRKPEGSHRSLVTPQLPTPPHSHPRPLHPLLLPGVSSPFLPSPLRPSPLLSLPALACVPPGTCSEPLLCARPGSTRPGRGGWDAKLQHTHTHTHTHHSENTVTPQQEAITSHAASLSTGTCTRSAAFGVGRLAPISRE